MGQQVVLEEYAKTKSRRKELIKKYLTIALFMSPFLLAFIVFFVFPLFYGIYISLTNYKFSAPGFNAEFNEFKWFKYLFLIPVGKEGEITAAQKLLFRSFWISFSHSIVFAIIMVPVAIILPLILAILVNMKPPGYKAFRSMIYMPSIVPLTASGTIFTLLFMNKAQNGLIPMLLAKIGIEIRWFEEIMFEFNLFGETMYVAYAWIPIFLMCLWGGWGSNFLILNAGLQNIPHNLYEAASIDGCSSFRQALKITIPGIKPQLVLCLFTTIIGYLGLYGQNFVLVGGGPIYAIFNNVVPAGGHTSTVIYFIQDIVANNANFKERMYGLAAAASLIYAVIVGTISGLQMYATRDKKSGFKKSEAYGQWQRAKSR